MTAKKCTFHLLFCFWLSVCVVIAVVGRRKLIRLSLVLPLPFFFSYGAERFEDGASQINKSDMFFGDDGELTDEQLKHMDDVTMKNVKFVKMTEGDVVLLDNYKTMHGRNVFDGTRKHGVAWFEGWEGEEEMKQKMKKEVSLSA